eukprot:scaffold20894_cov56-Isochrysis_galbana.AAC.1
MQFPPAFHQWPVRDHNRLALMRQPLPQLFCEEGHVRVEQPKAGVEHVDQGAAGLDTVGGGRCR